MQKNGNVVTKFIFFHVVLRINISGTSSFYKLVASTFNIMNLLGHKSLLDYKAIVLKFALVHPILGPKSHITYSLLPDKMESYRKVFAFFTLIFQKKRKKVGSGYFSAI